MKILVYAGAWVGLGAIILATLWDSNRYEQAQAASLPEVRSELRVVQGTRQRLLVIHPAPGYICFGLPDSGGYIVSGSLQCMEKRQ